MRPPLRTPNPGTALLLVVIVAAVVVASVVAYRPMSTEPAASATPHSFGSTTISSCTESALSSAIAAGGNATFGVS
ncbi:MAG TPA: hypothetical protein VGP88_04460, partial [Thermoplasmata archaeon]|nr:hypothetical protein [Thermoplasmata archaeon]